MPDLIKRIALTAGKMILFLIVWGALYAPFVMIGGSRVTIELAGALTILLAAWILTRWIDRRDFVSIGFDVSYAGRDLAVGLVLGVAMMSLVVLALWSFGFAQREALVGFSWNALGVAAGVVMANTVTQEVLVRGYIQQTIQSYFGTASGCAPVRAGVHVDARSRDQARAASGGQSLTGRRTSQCGVCNDEKFVAADRHPLRLELPPGSDPRPHRERSIRGLRMATISTPRNPAHDRRHIRSRGWADRRRGHADRNRGCFYTDASL